MKWFKNPNDCPGLVAAETSDDHSGIEIFATDGTCCAPDIHAGATVFVDTRLQPRDGDYVSVALPSEVLPGSGFGIIKKLRCVREADGSEVWILVSRLTPPARLDNLKIEGVVIGCAPGTGPTDLGRRVDEESRKLLSAWEQKTGRSIAEFWP